MISFSLRQALDQRLPTIPLLFVLFLLGPVLAGLPEPGAAQTVKGHLYDSESRAPVVNGTVALRDSLGSVVARASSSEEGAFVLPAPRPGLYTLLAVGLGYRSSPSSPFVIEAEGETTVDIFLSPKPIEIAGFDVGGGTFSERLSRVDTGLDLRLAELPGTGRVIGPERVRLYDNTHAKDPYKLLWREFDMGWSHDADALRHSGAYARRGQTEAPEVYIDDRRTWLLDLVLKPNSLICRVEVYEPPPEFYDLSDYMKTVMVPFQVRAYTCQFMAQVATGARSMRKYLNWGDLIAGPGGGVE